MEERQIQRGPDGRCILCDRFICIEIHQPTPIGKRGETTSDDMEDDLAQHIGLDAGYDPFKGEVIGAR